MCYLYRRTGLADTPAMAIAASDTSDADRRGNRTCGRIGAVATPTIIVSTTRLRKRRYIAACATKR